MVLEMFSLFFKFLIKKFYQIFKKKFFENIVLLINHQEKLLKDF